MRQLPFYCIWILLFLSCNEECKTIPQTSKCILDKIEIFKQENNSKAVLSFEKDCKLYYWFNNDETLRDGTEDIFDEECNLACTLCGECFPPKCVKDFSGDKSQWVVVWKR
jgi:hypothetical protein